MIYDKGRVLVYIRTLPS